jgi:AraC family transcriptional regulator of adaptative response/methylated-DNA-[protein]-cysteine methyltransferase
VFVTGVLTTGICRPSCPARHPARGNVRFFPDGAAAQEAGLRACLRCRPDDLARDAAAVAEAIAMIKEAEEAPALAQLAAQAGYSPAHFQRCSPATPGCRPPPMPARCGSGAWATRSPGQAA